VCQLLYLIIFVPYNLFKLFLVHKISAYKYICEKGKRNGKRKKKRNSRLTGPGGISAWSGAGVRRRGQMGPYDPRGAGDGAVDGVGAGPRAREGEGRRRQGGRRAVCGGGEPVAGEPDGGSSPVVRFLVDGVVAKHEGGVGGHGGGVNLTGGGLGWPVHGGWRALAAVKSPARPLGAIGDEQVCARLATERRTLRARAI
jgi:hypothetical protein